MPKLIPPSPLGSNLDSSEFQQFLELIRNWINAPKYYEKSVNPSLDDVAPGTWNVWRNSTTGEVRLWVNEGGVLKSVLLT